VIEIILVEQALNGQRLFILDYHDAFMSFLEKINKNAKAYATRTILFLKDDGTLKPVAIELSLPHPNGVKLSMVLKAKSYCLQTKVLTVQFGYWPRLM
jgi:linoleate 9S-lipoxygenase